MRLLGIILPQANLSYTLKDHQSWLPVSYDIIMSLLGVSRRWITHMQTLFSLFFYFYTAKTSLILLRNVWASSTRQPFARLNRVLTSYKRFNCFLPDLTSNQLKAFFKYKAQFYQIRPQTRARHLTWSAALMKYNTTHHFFYNRRKFHQQRLINFRRNFRTLRRNYFLQLRETFYLGKVRPIAMRRLLARFVNKSLLILGLSFSLNPVHLVHRVFPFFDRFFIQHMLRVGVVWVNFSQLTDKFYTLHVGDFLHIVWSPLLRRLYLKWLRRQQSYLYEMNRSLHYYYKARRNQGLTRRKNYLRRLTWHTHLFRPMPNWVEANYLSLSLFIVKVPSRLTFNSSNFNPYLNRLLAF